MDEKKNGGDRRTFLRATAVAASGVAVATLAALPKAAEGQEKDKPLADEQIVTKKHGNKSAFEEIVREAKDLAKQASVERNDTITVKRETVERISSAFISLYKANKDRSMTPEKAAAAGDDYGVLCDYFPKPTDFAAD